MGVGTALQYVLGYLSSGNPNQVFLNLLPTDNVKNYVSPDIAA